jgi:hypothetical protein
MSSFRIQILASIEVTLSITPTSAGQCSQDLHKTAIEAASRLGAIA